MFKEKIYQKKKKKEYIDKISGIVNIFFQNKLTHLSITVQPLPPLNSIIVCKYKYIAWKEEDGEKKV